MLADKTYDSRDLRAFIDEIGAKAVIPSNRQRKGPISHDEIAHKDRNRIERCFDRLKHFRRLATRYDQRTITAWPSSTSPPSCSGYAECRFVQIRSSRRPKTIATDFTSSS
ncbi:transposase [Inquilinus limosus]|uniref:transposase n=1 Tax=Inquilinus limosus TaxID=171674 RepID=UPI003F17B776